MKEHDLEAVSGLIELRKTILRAITVEKDYGPRRKRNWQDVVAYPEGCFEYLKMDELLKLMTPRQWLKIEKFILPLLEERLEEVESRLEDKYGIELTERKY